MHRAQYAAACIVRPIYASSQPKRNPHSSADFTLNSADVDRVRQRTLFGFLRSSLTSSQLTTWCSSGFYSPLNHRWVKSAHSELKRSLLHRGAKLSPSNEFTTNKVTRGLDSSSHSNSHSSKQHTFIFCFHVQKRSTHIISPSQNTRQQSGQEAQPGLTCFQLSKTMILLSSSSTVTVHSYPSPAETSARW